MFKRILFGTLGALYLVLMFTLGDWFFYLSVMAFALIGMSEIFNAFANIGYKPASLAAFFSVLIFYSCNYLGYFHIIGLFILPMLVVLSLHVLSNKYTLPDISLTIMGLVYPGIFFSFLIFLKDLNPAYGNSILILNLIASFSTDTFAYFVGLAIGKHKLCPEISPKKTIEGSIGGLFGSVIVTLVFGHFINKMYTLNINLIHYLIIGLLTGVFSQIGDLCASRIKRQCNIKDFGKLIPGHGGILDRFDSVLFTSPIIYLYFLFFLTS